MPAMAELAALLDVAERPRAGGWSLRAALVRYAQPEPQRSSDLIELVRRIEGALRPRWKALEQGAEPDDRERALLDALRVLDHAGDALASWAVDRATDRPDAAVDEAIVDVTGRLATLGVAREERRPPPGARSRG